MCFMLFEDDCLNVKPDEKSKPCVLGAQVPLHFRKINCLVIG